VKNILLERPTLEKFISVKDYSNAAKLLLAEQKKSWTDLRKNYDLFKDTRNRVFQFKGFTIKIQHNPGRIKSTSARVDEKSIYERRCFLCYDNLYEGQKAIKYGEDFLILVNPFPIFPEHFTIPHRGHIPQSIREWFGRTLSLSKDLSEYVIIYNGPECGASAPDHLHFQAGSKNFIPIESEIDFLKNTYGDVLLGKKSLTVAGIDDGLRRFITIKTNAMVIVEKVFDLFYGIYAKAVGKNVEPMMNIISFYNKESGWEIIIFLREKHRPSHYFRDGEDKILLSPAAVDLGGVCILPLEKDFNKITKGNIAEVFKEVSLNKEQFEFIRAKLKTVLNS
jgi:hypothetical protein